MFWADELARRVPPDRPHVVNDSKTPSGLVPVSSLRGVIMHDAINRALRHAGLESRFVYGIDDMDPMDSQSMRTDEAIGPHMGKPLSAIPAPEAGGTDYADLYAGRFIAAYADLGVRPSEIYRMRDLYRQGKMDAAIDRVLRKADIARDVLARIGNVKKPADYHPLHVICENCGRVGTTYVSAYDGREVTYTCRKELVTWAEGCGRGGKVSPFGGRAKLTWNLEWCAQWDFFGVTIEGCGKDLSTAGGSRERSDELYREIWGKDPPLNVPYEFVTVAGGRKMSTSRAQLWADLGAAAHEIVELLTGELVRFLMLRARPNTHIEFDPTGDRIPRHFDEYDRAAAAFEREPASEWGRLYALSQTSEEPRTGFRAPFGLVANWLQIPGLDARSAAASRAGRPLTEWELNEFARRMAVARNWLERWAPESAKFSVTPSLPAATNALSDRQRELLRRVRNALANGVEAERLEGQLYELGRELGLSAKETFAAIYLAFIGKPHGPPAAPLLASLNREFARRRLEEAAAS